MAPKPNIVDNPTNYPLSNMLFSDYGFELSWNANKGSKELLHREYVKSLGGNVTAHRSRRLADIVSRSFSIVPFSDTPFMIKWVWNSEFYCMLYDGKKFTIRQNDMGEYL